MKEQTMPKALQHSSAFYVKNDLKTREDIKDIIMRPIWQRFGLQKPKVEIEEAAEECQRAFGVVCSFIGTRDLI